MTPKLLARILLIITLNNMTEDKLMRKEQRQLNILKNLPIIILLGTFFILLLIMSARAGLPDSFTNKR